MKLCGVCILTDNVPQLVEFYTIVLKENANDDAVHSSFNEAQLAIWNPGNIVISPHKNMSLMYYVDDADSEFERLKNSELPIDFIHKPIVQRWGVKAFAFKDPDGNVVNFLQPIDIKI